MRNTFGKPIIPSSDEERLKALHRYEILNTPPEGAFNRIAALAAKLFKTPIALISLVDKERVFFKANVGLPGVKSEERGVSLCSLAVLQEDPVVFENAEEEPCLLANPNVAGAFGLKFYAGAPLITADGFSIGTICVIDKAPRKFSQSDKEMLQDLASIVMDEIEIRISSIRAIRGQNDLLHIAVHDLKNPLSNIQALAELLSVSKDEHFKEKSVGLIQESAVKMVSLIERLVKLSQIEDSGFALDLQQVNAGELAKGIIKNNQFMAQKKGQVLSLYMESPAIAIMDKEWMREVFDNLINNAIKYSPEGKAIDVLLKADEKGFYFEVKDQGLGFNEDDKAKAFKKFSKLSSRPTGGETSSGLGLSIVKKLVELHEGTVSLESEGKNKGSRILIHIPPLEKV